MVYKKFPWGGGMHVAETYIEQVERQIPLPNWHQFYIRYRLLPSGGGGGGGAETRVWIYNQTQNPIYYQIARGGGQFEQFCVQPNHHYWHSTTANPPNPSSTARFRM